MPPPILAVGGYRGETSGRSLPISRHLLHDLLEPAQPYPRQVTPFPLIVKGRVTFALFVRPIHGHGQVDVHMIGINGRFCRPGNQVPRSVHIDPDLGGRYPFPKLFRRGENGW